MFNHPWSRTQQLNHLKQPPQHTTHTHTHTNTPPHHYVWPLATTWVSPQNHQRSILHAAWFHATKVTKGHSPRVQLGPLLEVNDKSACSRLEGQLASRASFDVTIKQAEKRRKKALRQALLPLPESLTVCLCPHSSLPPSVKQDVL